MESLKVILPNGTVTNCLVVPTVDWIQLRVMDVKPGRPQHFAWLDFVRHCLDWLQRPDLPTVEISMVQTSPVGPVVRNVLQIQPGPGVHCPPTKLLHGVCCLYQTARQILGTPSRN